MSSICLFELLLTSFHDFLNDVILSLRNLFSKLLLLWIIAEDIWTQVLNYFWRCSLLLTRILSFSLLLDLNMLYILTYCWELCQDILLRLLIVLLFHLFQLIYLYFVYIWWSEWVYILIIQIVSYLFLHFFAWLSILINFSIFSHAIFPFIPYAISSMNSRSSSDHIEISNRFVL